MYLVLFPESALVLELNAYVEEPVHETFTGIQEKILISVMDIMEAAGTSIAVALQAVRFPRGPEELKT